MPRSSPAGAKLFVATSRWVPGPLPSELQAACRRRLRLCLAAGLMCFPETRESLHPLRRHAEPAVCLAQRLLSLISIPSPIQPHLAATKQYSRDRYANRFGACLPLNHPRLKAWWSLFSKINTTLHIAAVPPKLEDYRKVLSFIQQDLYKERLRSYLHFCFTQTSVEHPQSPSHVS